MSRFLRFHAAGILLLLSGAALTLGRPQQAPSMAQVAAEAASACDVGKLERSRQVVSGKSYNIYNMSLKRWEQYWVDKAGGNIFFYGGRKDGAMNYWTDEIPQPDGKNLKRHLQFIKLGPDKVRQFSQGSSDGGKTWFVEHDFTYSRKK